MAAKDEPVYVGIEHPAEVRRALLESSKSLIKILQKSERLRENKRQKQQLIMQLKETMREITQLVSQLKSQMPKVRISSLPKRRAAKPVTHEREENQPEKQKETRTTSLPKPKPVHFTESQKLEKELQDIEEKLKRL